MLNSVNRSAGEDIYLTSTEDVTQLPRFLRGRKPDAKTLRTEKAVSCAVVVVEKGDGVVDAFYMYFYTFNRGPSVYGHVIGDHLGDWLVSFLFLLSSFSFPLLSSLLSHLFKHTSRANSSQTQGAQHDPLQGRSPLGCLVLSTRVRRSLYLRHGSQDRSASHLLQRARVPRQLCHSRKARSPLIQLRALPPPTPPPLTNQPPIPQVMPSRQISSTIIHH